MILPETTVERDYAYAIAALGLRARAQSVAGDNTGANTILAARRALIAKGVDLYTLPRNNGLVEFADVLAAQDDKPQAFLEFLANQESVVAAALEAKRAKAVVVDPEPEPVVVAEPEPEPEPVAVKPARRRRTKKES